jgi:glycosyltransferase involved in cell wall biosynthesis
MPPSLALREGCHYIAAASIRVFPAKNDTSPAHNRLDRGQPNSGAVHLKMSEPVQITYVGNFLSKHGLNPAYSELLVPQLKLMGYRISCASSYLNPALRLADIIQRILRTPRRNACVILDLYSGPRAFYAADFAAGLCRAAGRRYIVVLHGGTLPGRLMTSRKRLARTVQGAQRVISPSRYLAENLGSLASIEVIPNALNLDDYPFRLRERVLPSCFYLRAIHRNCGALIAIEAMGRISDEYPTAKLNMAGPEMDNCLADCERLIAHYGLSNRVSLLGRISKLDIVRYGNQADIFLNPTFADNTPVSVVEAMAMGLCVVASRVGGLPYLLTHNETALLVDPGDASALAEAVRRILHNPGLATHLSRNARREAERMDWSCVLPCWKKVINSVVNTN